MSTTETKPLKPTETGRPTAAPRSAESEDVVGKAIRTQTRRPGPTHAPRGIHLDTTKYHFVKVQKNWHSTEGEYETLMSTGMYADLGYQEGHCDKADQVLLVCTRQDFERLQNGYVAESIDKAQLNVDMAMPSPKATARLNVERESPLSFKELPGSIQDPD